MSAGDKYFTAPLAILRSGTSAREALGNALHFGIVSAGIGYQQTHDADEFDTLLDEGKRHAEKQNQPTKPTTRFTLTDADGKPMTREESERIWNCALAGSKLLDVSGGNRASHAQTWATHHKQGQVFFRIKSEWLWNAIYTARKEAGEEVKNEFKPMSWREFRLLSAILSSKVNTYHFTFLGWESIQARACGFHSKELFEKGRATLPAHCEPLTRQMIRDGCDKLEALGFFARCRYSRGRTGGLMAYSFRHPKREGLQAAVLQWDAANHSFKTKTASHRASDQAAFKRTK